MQHVCCNSVKLQFWKVVVLRVWTQQTVLSFFTVMDSQQTCYMYLFCWLDCRIVVSSSWTNTILLIVLIFSQEKEELLQQNAELKVKLESKVCVVIVKTNFMFVFSFFIIIFWITLRPVLKFTALTQWIASTPRHRPPPHLLPSKNSKIAEFTESSLVIGMGRGGRVGERGLEQGSNFWELFLRLWSEKDGWVAYHSYNSCDWL